jgi:hypothetical protein
LTRVDPQLLPEALLVQNQVATNTRAVASLSSGDEGRLFRIALVLLLVLLFFETYFAWRIGSSAV